MWWWLGLALAAPPELVTSLSARHASQTCDEFVETYGVEALVEVAEGTEMPPWLPMRAASCVGAAVDRGGDAAVLRWLGNDALPGLAVAAVAGLEQARTLPEGLAPAVAARLADPRFARGVRLERSRHPALVELVTAGD
ncbi:MAG: hypothetical protein EP330_19430 [Deltaproteobacteria bacterium]|nr:MAG: hypothetical protein EP330_19430 [Deltaproteobacteria bacterium]